MEAYKQEFIDFLLILYTIMRKRVVENMTNICHLIYTKSLTIVMLL